MEQSEKSDLFARDQEVKKAKPVAFRKVFVAILIFVGYAALFTVLHLFLPSVFGYVIISGITLNFLISLAVEPQKRSKIHPALRALLFILGGAFEYIVRFHFETGELGMKQKHFNLFLPFAAVQFFMLEAFFWIWLLRTPVYLAVSAVLSFIVFLFIIFSKLGADYKFYLSVLLFATFGYGYIVIALCTQRLIFSGTRRRYAKIDRECGISLARAEDVPKTEADAVAENAVFRGCGIPAFASGDIEYLPSGESFFSSALDAMRGAEEFIFIEFFIVSDGCLLDAVSEILIEKAARGVEVRLIYDELGSAPTLSSASVERLRAGGVKLIPYNPLIGTLNTHFNYRDHRKIIVVDGKVAYTGGINIADEYINRKLMHGYWKDSGALVRGKAADAFSLIFLRQWVLLSGKAESFEPYISSGSENSSADGGIILPVSDGVELSENVFFDLYAEQIASAKEKLYIMMPYFVPPEKIARLIKERAAAGVDVRIILPEVPDKEYVYVVSRFNAESLIRCGVKVYLMRGSFVHSKVVVTESSAVVSSSNLDARSLYQQLECGVYSSKKKFVSDVLLDFERIMPLAKEIGEGDKIKKNPIQMILYLLMRLFSPLL